MDCVWRFLGLAVAPTAAGVRPHCVFQRLEGEATSEGLWLTSTVTNQAQDRFRVVAAAVGRSTMDRSADSQPTSDDRQPNAGYRPARLPKVGEVSVEDQTVRFTRPGLVEEYTVSTDGVRQDCTIERKPPGEGQLRVELAVTGAKVEPSVYGAQLVLEKSGRRIAYSRLRVSDAAGKELSARMEVAGESETRPVPRSRPAKDGNLKSEMGLAVVVDDMDAVYPLRIDPTFSDANWISMNPSIPGADNVVYAAVADGSGNLYIGGGFTVVGDVFANRIAKWDGSSWSALGSGVNNDVYALAVSGSDLYAGGWFTMAGEERSRR